MLLEDKYLREFLKKATSAKRKLFLSDYDGTLAPFRIERDAAFPYPGIKERLEEIVDFKNTRTVLITGRSAHNLKKLLDLKHNVEIWGSHGAERLAADGTHILPKIDPTTHKLFEQAKKWGQINNISDRLEQKPGCLAFHFRGLNPKKTEELKTEIFRLYTTFGKDTDLAMREFDGGLELRSIRYNKGDAIRTLVNEESKNIPLVYLGDDLTDEDAFKAMPSGALSILVTKESKPTAAKVWISPPKQLIEFLDLWINICSQ